MTEESVLMPRSVEEGRQKRSSTATSLIWSAPLSLAIIFVVAPLWLFVLIPLALVSILVTYAWASVSSPESTRAAAASSWTSPTPSLTANDPREFQLVLYGATGFTGQLAAHWIANNHPGLKWAIAGRNRDALDKIRNKVGAPNLPIIVADSSDIPSIDALVRRTKVVMSTAGPFALFGENLVKACAQNGTHWADITGEIDWVREMIDKNDEAARRSGAMIVSLCGHDSVPWDLCVFKLHKCLQEKNDSLSRVELFDDIRAQASGGTMATVFNALEGKTKFKRANLGYDPLLKDLDGRKDLSKFAVRNPMVIGWSKLNKSWFGPFFMASVNANCVRRSNALLKYSPGLSYAEAQSFPNLFECLNQNVLLLVFATMLASYPLRWLMLTLGFLPKPGQGPTAEQMEAGHLVVTGYGAGQNGQKAKCVMTFNRDAGYLDTARMLAECALLLAEKDPRNPDGGCHTPASAFGEDLLDRLCATGTQFNVSVVV